MKFTKYALLAAGCVMMASCSSDEPALDGQNPADTPVEGGSTGFAQFDIKLPQVAGGTRADNGFAGYEDGTPQEYAVTNGRIIVFKKGATEAAATYVCTADLTGMSWNLNNDTEITTTSTTRAQLSNINLNDNSQYAAVIVLNYNNDFQFPTSSTTTFGEWSKQPQTGSMILTQDGKSYLTMTNAAKYVSATAEPTILVDIDKSMIAQTENKIPGSAGTIYVQRATAKVTVKPASDVAISGTAYPNDKVTIDAWALDITNKSSFPVQVTDGLKASFSEIWNGGDTNNLNRFFGGTRFARVFWALDPNYDTNIDNQAAIEANFNVIDASAVTTAPAQAYCLENTFDINHMLQGQTTRVVLKGTYKPANIPAGENFYKVGSDTKLWSTATLKADIEAKAQTALNSEDVTVELGAVATTKGYHSLKEITIKKGADVISDAEYATVASDLGLPSATDKGIATYDKGTVYYIARIKHFGDEDCPWNIGNDTYAGNNAKWLGRYGMVRNNWYELDVKSISNPGSPDVPVIKPTTPDDESEYFIQVEVNLLSWAKRVQNVDL